MKTRIPLLFNSILLLFILFSCSKYENGPKFTLLTKKSRVVGDWKIVETLLNNEPITLNPNSTNNTYSFEKNNDYIISGEANQTQPAVQKGSWGFTEDKSSLLITLDGDTDTLKISKLKNKSMWLERELQGGVLLYRYEQ